MLIQADCDGELSPAEAARVAAHLDTCPDCAGLQARLLALSARLREEAPRYQAPAPLRRSVRARLTGHGPARRWWAATGAAAALAACLTLAVLPARQDTMPDWIVAAHIRGLQQDHLLDVASGEQHTVKPWFAGRLPFAPPVRDLSAQGFPLAGGRLDYLPGNTAATLVYRRRQHIIGLFIWPAEAEEAGSGAGVREGYNYVRWQANGMTFWAVSDLNARELGEFAALWR